jgi:hypothetical protein
MQGNFALGLAKTYAVNKLYFECKCVAKEIKCKLYVHRVTYALMQGGILKSLIGQPNHIQPPANARKFVDGQSLDPLWPRWSQAVLI